MTDPIFTLSLTAAALALLSLIALWRGGRSWAIGALLGLLAAAGGFLWAAFVLPRAPGPVLLWHLGIGVAALVLAAALWRASGLRRAYGIGFAAALLLALTCSAVVFPAWVAGRLAAVAGDDPVCVVDRSGRTLGMGGVTFLGLDKDLFLGPDGLQMDLPLTAFVRTAEPQPRKDTPRNFALPPGLYDVAVFNWSETVGGFKGHSPSVVLRQIPCIPRQDGLQADPRADHMEMATAWGDFAVPLDYRPREARDAFSFRVPLHVLLNEPAPAQDDEVPLLIGRLKFGEVETELNSTPSPSRDEALAAGYAPDVDGFLRLETEGSIRRLRHAPDGRPLTELVCWKAPEADADCEHDFVAEETEAGFSTSIYVYYPPAYADRWEEIEAALRPIVAGFSVPGPVAVQSLRPRPRPDCPGAVCEGMDALP